MKRAVICMCKAKKHRRIDEFLMETVFISTLGVPLDLILGLAVSYVLAAWTYMDVLSWLWIMLAALLVSMTVGLRLVERVALRLASVRTASWCR